MFDWGKRMGNNHENMDLYESDTTKLCSLVVDSINEFKQNQQDGKYNAADVDSFLDDLVRLIRFYKGYQGDDIIADESDHEELSDIKNIFNAEYSGVKNAIVDEIVMARFTQNFMGYDTPIVDDFLNDLVKLVDFHGDYENIHIMVDTNAIVSKRFVRTFRGYDELEVDKFLNKMIKAFENLNDIKKKYL